MAEQKSIQGVPLYSAEQVREFDRIAIQELGIPGYNLMEQAGEAAFAALLTQWPQVRHMTVFCGGGNNGGDGYVIARLAHQHEIQVQLIAVSPLDQLTGDAKTAAQMALEDGLEAVTVEQADWPTQGIIVDALLGSGLNGPVRAPFDEIIQRINDSDVPVISVDIPSGLNGTTGQVMGSAVYADMTVTMIANKQGLYTHQGPAYCGDVRLARLGLQETVYQRAEHHVELINWHSLVRQGVLQPRAKVSHKGDHGHVMIIGGDYGFGGACILAASAALRSGAGLVSVATQPEHVPAILARHPEVMAHGVTSGQDLQPLLERADVIVIGPGLGQGHWGQQLLQQVMAIDTPIVVDADAINLLAQKRIQHNLPARSSVLTPHPGEAARLLATETHQVQANRFDAANAIAQEYQSAVVLKGAGSLIAQNNRISICGDGNPGMASGGMGDILSGVLGALVASELSLENAVKAAVCLHSAAADDASVSGEKGLLATDLLPAIRSLLN